jgi:hypothetical protein
VGVKLIVFWPGRTVTGPKQKRIDSVPGYTTRAIDLGFDGGAWQAASAPSTNPKMHKAEVMAAVATLSDRLAALRFAVQTEAC